VKIAHGSSNSNKFAILKKAKFPAKHQQGATTKDFKNHLMENKKKPSHIKYGDFNFLIYLADVLDI
jgi:nuclear protein localization family protein 4